MKKVTWDTVQWKTGLPEKVSQALAVKFIEMQREGKSLYMLTLMFGYVPGLLRDGGNGLEKLKKRIEIMWEGIHNRLFNRADLSGSFGVVFWDQGIENGRNMGFHAHILFGVDESRFRGKYKGSFLQYWQKEAERWIARKSDSGERDPIVRSHLQVYDGAEACIKYCGKSIGGPSGLGLGDLLYLLPPKRGK